MVQFIGLPGTSAEPGSVAFPLSQEIPALLSTTLISVGTLPTLLFALKKAEGKNIFIDGGAEIVNLLMKENLIDDFYISIVPILLGEGIRLFKDGLPEQKLRLINSECFGTGLVQLHYELNGK